MPKVTYISSTGEKRTLDLKIGMTIMEGAVQNDVKGIVAECGGSCMCATCHVHVEEKYLDKLPEISDTESEMLDNTKSGRKSNSRLGCQLRVNSKFDGMTIHIPEEQ